MPSFFNENNSLTLALVVGRHDVQFENYSYAMSGIPPMKRCDLRDYDRFIPRYVQLIASSNGHTGEVDS
jgi:hypothetical protein